VTASRTMPPGVAPPAGWWRDELHQFIAVQTTRLQLKCVTARRVWV